MLIVIISVLIDQITKYFACNLKAPIVLLENLLSFEYIENYGGVFGIMQGSNYILGAISSIMCITIIVYLFKTKNADKKAYVAWYMILAGGIGNLIDRVARGFVVDFIATPFIATFNIADSLVVIGVAMMVTKEIVDSLRNKKNKEEKE